MRLFLGIILISFGCLLDFSCFGLGTSIRFFAGLMGALLIVGNLNFKYGGLITMMMAFITYSYVIKHGPLVNYFGLIIERNMKYSIRFISAILFMVEYSNLKNKL
jgi:hypothetical protein